MRRAVKKYINPVIAAGLALVDASVSAVRTTDSPWADHLGDLNDAINQLERGVAACPRRHGAGPPPGSPLRHREKKITTPGWGSLRLTSEGLACRVSPDGNIGVLLGANANGLSDVDLDCSDAVLLAPRFLTPTEAVFSRPGKPSSHWLYHATGNTETAQYEDSGGAMLPLHGAMAALPSLNIPTIAHGPALPGGA